MRFKLPEAAFRKLCRLVKQRDEELAETYQSIIGEWPPSRGEVHHAKHAGSGGPDKEDNLIHQQYLYIIRRTKIQDNKKSPRALDRPKRG